jgi:serralysin
MTRPGARICFERIVPSQFSAAAREKALAENSANGSPFELAGVRSKLWHPHRTLRVAFLDGLPEVQQQVARHATEWSRHAGVTFEFAQDGDADIRITFNPDLGSWSALGTDGLVEAVFPRHEATMNFGWLTPTSSESDYSGVVLHEFGHALGMIHEHQSPAAGIAWDRAAVIADLSGPPNNWDAETIEFNVFGRYSADQTQFTQFDPESIMLYAFPSHWTTNGLAFRENTSLSVADKQFIKMRYPS